MMYSLISLQFCVKNSVNNQIVTSHFRSKPEDGPILLPECSVVLVMSIVIHYTMEKVSRVNEFNYLLYSHQPVHQYLQGEVSK
jgi:hypothetical protein